MIDPAAIYAKAVDAFNQCDWQRAQELTEHLLSIAPEHAGIHYISGIAHMELQQMSPALEHLRRAIELAPSRADYVAQYAKALSTVRRLAEAKCIADRALKLTPNDPKTLDTIGVVYTRANAYSSAIEAFRRAIIFAPKHATYRFNLAASLIAMGDIDAAEEEIEACLAIDPQYWRAHYSLAQLRRQTPTGHHIKRLQSLLPNANGNIPAQICLNLALAKEYEDLADYSNAFKHLVEGKSVGRSTHNYTIRKDETLFEAITRTFPEPQTVNSGFLTTEPIFVVGMPRTGTTLVERIISSHPDVYSAGELLNFGMAMKYVSGTLTPNLIDLDTLAGLHDPDWTKLGETYIATTRPTTGHTPRFLDKLPHNFLNIGFIAHALPNAKIICLRRDPMDTCLSNFRQLFTQESPYFDYSFDILNTGRYYVLFDRLMAHWHRVFPGRILEIDYETLVESQEANSRKLLEHCNLDWNENCLRFEENPSPVATPSAIQVRTPIYKTAIKRWKKYEAQLGELHALLTDAGIRLEP